MIYAINWLLYVMLIEKLFVNLPYIITIFNLGDVP